MSESTLVKNHIVGNHMTWLISHESAILSHSSWVGITLK